MSNEQEEPQLYVVKSRVTGNWLVLIDDGLRYEWTDKPEAATHFPDMLAAVEACGKRGLSNWNAEPVQDGA